MHEDAASRLIRRRRTTKEGIIRSVHHLIRLRRGNELTRKGVVTNARANRCLVRRASVNALHERRATSLDR